MKLKYIDALRGVAIIAVICVHTGQHGSYVHPGVFKSIIVQGARGVQLFYLVSAFTLFLSFDYRSKIEANPNRNFFIRRFFRIAPLYYLGIVYYLFQNGLGPRYWLGDCESITIGNIISNLTFIHGVNPYWITSLVPGGWSITVEMTFYAIVPFLFKRLKSTNQAVTFTLVCFLVSLLLQFILKDISIISSERLWNEYLFLWFPNQIALFGLGIIAYFIIIKKDKTVSGLNYLIISILLMLNFAWSYIPKHFLFGLSFLVLILALSIKENPLIVNRITMFLGKISYSGYLTHFAVLHWLTWAEYVDFIEIQGAISSLVNFSIRLLITVSLTSLLSWLLLNIIEIPFQKIGRKIITKLEVRK